MVFSKKKLKVDAFCCWRCHATAAAAHGCQIFLNIMYQKGEKPTK
jgi:hypothetical protein